MAFTERALPLVNTSVLRQIRAGAFRQKAPLGPATTQAVVEGSLREEGLRSEREAIRLAQVGVEQLRIEEMKRQADLTAGIEGARLEQQQKQFDAGLLLKQQLLDAELQHQEQERADEYEKNRPAKKKKKWWDPRGCFITTAVCNSLNKSDDCDELVILRGYRDGWLKENHPEEIQRYYNIAPSIVEAVSKKDNSTEIWKGVNERYIQPCIKDIKSERYVEAYERYKAMVDELIKEGI